MAVDLDPQRLKLACQLGADDGLNARDLDVASEVLRMTRGRGADVAAEVVGNTRYLARLARARRRAP